MGISLTADASPGNDKGLAVNGQVGHDPAGVGILDDRADRDGDDNVFGASSGPVIALSLLPSFGCVVLLILQIEQRTTAAHGFDDDVTALAAVSAIRPPPGHEFLAPETDATLAAAARFDVNFSFINKFHNLRPISRESYADFS